jgi:cytochrome c biogenesis protein CcmG/thiol:disulfide interchange protein DsbE
VGLDREDALANRYGITGVPESFVIDTQGRVAFLHVGPVSAEQFVQELETLLEGETP